MGAMKVCVADMDNDGDKDIISAGYSGEIAWYENDMLNGLSMSGVLLDDTMAGIHNGKVSLLELSLTNVAATIVQTTYSNNTGIYHFNGVQGNSYIIKADVTDSIPATLPTYYPDAFFWGSSEQINLQSDTTGLDINILYQPTPPAQGTGLGKIYGYLLEGIGLRGPGSPIDSVIVGMTRPDSSGSIYMFDTTDTTGYFEFSHLPPGNYALYPDISGVPLDTAGWATISIAGTDTEKVNFVADSNLIYVDSSVATNIREYIPGLKLWPNPVYDQLSVSLTSTVKAVRVYDIKGAEVKPVIFQTDDRLTISVNGLEKGIYILELRYEGRTGLAKFVKQ